MSIFFQLYGLLFSPHLIIVDNNICLLFCYFLKFLCYFQTNFYFVSLGSSNCVILSRSSGIWIFYQIRLPEHSLLEPSDLLRPGLVALCACCISIFLSFSFAVLLEAGFASLLSRISHFLYPMPFSFLVYSLTWQSTFSVASRERVHKK